MAPWMKRSRPSRTLLALLLWLPWLLLPGRCWAYPCNEKYRKFSLRHTMCLPPRPDCRIYSSGVSRKEIKEILAAHNSYRRQVANGKIRRLAPAANMLELVWDPELATVAQAHANQCRFHHDCHPCRRVSRFTTGQNLFMHYSSSLKQQPTNWTNVAKSWFDEYKIFDVSEVDSLQTVEDSGHFSQMIWAETSHVGCGKARFKIRGEDWYKTLYTCNYGPVGNVITSKIYEKGRPCSRCPNNTVCSASNPGLCGVRGRTLIQLKLLGAHFCGFAVPSYLDVTERTKRTPKADDVERGGHNDGYMSGYRFPQPHQQDLRSYPASMPPRHDQDHP
ncbi:venom allergen 3-like [Haemaphysalis longicornis]